MAIVSCEHWMDWNPRIYINAEVVGVVWGMEVNWHVQISGDGIDAFQNLNRVSKSDGRHRV